MEGLQVGGWGQSLQIVLTIHSSVPATYIPSLEAARVPSCIALELEDGAALWSVAPVYIPPCITKTQTRPAELLTTHWQMGSS